MAGLSLRRFSLVRSLLVGTAVGTVALLIDGYLLMPGIQQLLHGRNLWAEHVPRWVAWVTHLVFGSSLGFYYWRWQTTSVSSSGPGGTRDEVVAAAGARPDAQSGR